MAGKVEKEIWQRTFELYRNQAWLSDKSEELSDLLDLCDNKVEQILLLELLDKFTYITQNQLGDLLNKMATYIVENSGFKENETQIAAITHDKEADSSQAILQSIKLHLSKKGWPKVQTVNSFGNTLKTITRHKLKQIIWVDEFIGSGSTLSTQIKSLQNSSQFDGECQIKCCFMAGIESAINEVRKKTNVEIFCPLPLKKGISEKYDFDEGLRKLEHMKSIEEKLNLEDKKYSLGFNQAEALYSGEGVQLNTPNSVFPVFWWPKANNSDRSTILHRYQKNLS